MRNTCRLYNVVGCSVRALCVRSAKVSAYSRDMNTFTRISVAILINGWRSMQILKSPHSIVCAGYGCVLFARIDTSFYTKYAGEPVCNICCCPVRRTDARERRAYYQWRIIDDLYFVWNIIFCNIFFLYACENLSPFSDKRTCEPYPCFGCRLAWCGWDGGEIWATIRSDGCSIWGCLECSGSRLHWNLYVIYLSRLRALRNCE